VRRAEVRCGGEGAAARRLQGAAAVQLHWRQGCGAVALAPRVRRRRLAVRGGIRRRAAASVGAARSGHERLGI
jgi:hypothetical protein